MALRIRKNGKILCAAMHPKKEGDLYIDDELHYYLSVETKVLVTEPWTEHKKRGEWWWKTKIPLNIEIDDFYFS